MHWRTRLKQIADRLVASGKDPEQLAAIREKLKTPQGRRTHCPQGHPYDEKNTVYDKRGCRYCVECKRTRARDRHRRLFMKGKPRKKDLMMKLKDAMNELAEKMVDNHKLIRGPVTSTISLIAPRADYSMVVGVAIVPNEMVVELQELLDKTARNFVEKTFGKPFEFKEDVEAHKLN
jgi:hypothetical protein